MTGSQRSGARDQPSGGRADVRRQPEFTSGVKRSGRRAGLVSVQCVQSRRAVVVLGRRDVSTRLRWPTDVSLRATSVRFAGISRWLRERAGSTRWETFVCRRRDFQRSGRLSFAWNDRLPTLWGPRPAFRRSRRRPQAAGIHFRRKAQRASCRSCARTVYPEQTGGGGTREKCRDCLPKGGRQKKRRRRTQGGTWTCFMASSRTSVVSTVRINEQGMIEHHILSGIVRSQ